MIKAIPMEDWLRGCVYHDGRHGYVSLPCDEVLKIADFIERLRLNIPIGEWQTFDDYSVEMIGEGKPTHFRIIQRIQSVESIKADRKTEPQYDIDKGTIKCDNCSENGSYKCSKCDGEMYFKRLEVEDEPQTDCPWK